MYRSKHLSQSPDLESARLPLCFLAAIRTSPTRQTSGEAESCGSVNWLSANQDDVPYQMYSTAGHDTASTASYAYFLGHF